jgi:CDP-diacylglycerol---glycerol-3-phosphate 3-phosphatidyltransferase
VRNYRLRDLLLLPNLLSAARLPLALVFPLTLSRPWLALSVLAAAAATDVLDGWFARRFGQATPIGAVVDGIADKVLAATVMVALVVQEFLSPVTAMLLATRELIELPLALGVLLSRRARELEIDRGANRAGKFATTLEFIVIALVILGLHVAPVAIGAVALLGAVAGVSYWRRELRALRSARKIDAPAQVQRGSVVVGDEGDVAHHQTA